MIDQLKANVQERPFAKRGSKREAINMQRKNQFIQSISGFTHRAYVFLSIMDRLVLKDIRVEEIYTLKGRSTRWETITNIL